jgi:hypothetical protein
MIQRIVKNTNLALIITVLFLLSTLQLFPYWWYNTITITILFGYILSTILIFENHTSNINFLFKIIFTSLLLLSKINIALPALILFETTTIFYCIIKIKNIKLYFLQLLLSIIILIIIIIFFDIRYKEYIELISLQSNRLNFQKFYAFYYYNESLINFIIPEFILASITILFFYNQKKIEIFSNFKQLIVVNLLIISFIGKITNNDFNIIENIIPILIILIFSFDTSQSKIKVTNYNFFLMLVLVVYLLFVIIKRDRIMAIGPFWEAKKTLYLQKNKDDYFYKFKIPSTLIEVERELYNSKNKIVQPAFFGPRIDHAYVKLNIEVQKNIPIWWEGISINSKYTKLFIQTNFKTLCFLNKSPEKGYNPDFTFLNDEIKLGLPSDMWYGCFGVQSYINHDFLLHIEQKYKITNMISNVLCRTDRCCLERIMGCIFFTESPKILKMKSFLGDITTRANWRKYTFDKYSEDLKKGAVPRVVVKVWSGR